MKLAVHLVSAGSNIAAAFFCTIVLVRPLEVAAQDACGDEPVNACVMAVTGAVRIVGDSSQCLPAVETPTCWPSKTTPTPRFVSPFNLFLGASTGPVALPLGTVNVTCIDGGSSTVGLQVTYTANGAVTLLTRTTQVAGSAPDVSGTNLAAGGTNLFTAPAANLGNRAVTVRYGLSVNLDNSRAATAEVRALTRAAGFSQCSGVIEQLQ